mgnify:CR=1 FL=1
MNQVISKYNSVKLKAYLQLIRAPGIFSIISNILASTYVYLFFVPSAEVSIITLSTLLILSGLCYQSGMILNDVADFIEDSRDRAFRPLPSGRLSRSFAIYCSVLFIAIAFILALSINIFLAIAVLVLIVLILTYNFLLKDSVFGPINMGLVRMVNWLLVMVSVQIFDHRMVWVASLVFIYTNIVTIVSRFETIDFSEKIKPILFALVTLMTVISVYLILQMNNGVMSLPLFAFLSWLIWQVFSFTPQSSQDTQQFVTVLLKSMVILDAVILIFFNQIFLGVFCSMLILLSSKLAKYVYMT